MADVEDRPRPCWETDDQRPPDRRDRVAFPALVDGLRVLADRLRDDRARQYADDLDAGSRPLDELRAIAREAFDYLRDRGGEPGRMEWGT